MILRATFPRGADVIITFPLSSRSLFEMSTTKPSHQRIPLAVKQASREPVGIKLKRKPTSPTADGKEPESSVVVTVGTPIKLDSVANLDGWGAHGPSSPAYSHGPKNTYALLSTLRSIWLEGGGGISLDGASATYNSYKSEIPGLS